MSSEFFRIELLPALHGDAIWIEYGDDQSTQRILIDGGPIGAWPALEKRLAALPNTNNHFELVVVSHVDTDHIDGILRMLALPNQNWNFQIDQFWFNGWDQIQPKQTNNGFLGAPQGEYLSSLLAHRVNTQRWNTVFKHQAVVVPDKGPLPCITLPGGMKLTLLSPTMSRLDKLRKTWLNDLKKAGLMPGNIEAAWQKWLTQKQYQPKDGFLSAGFDLEAWISKKFPADSSEANGSSIACLAEFAGKSCLFLADAHADVLCSSLDRLLAERKLERLKVDAVKVPHHGSKSNMSVELIKKLDCGHYLISTNGDKFRHPDKEALAILCKESPQKPITFHFNYRSAYTAPWLDVENQAHNNFHAVVRADEQPSLLLNL